MADDLNPIQEAIRDMNENAGAEPATAAVPPAIPPAAEAPQPAAQPPKPAASPAATPPVTPAPQPGDDDYTPPEPAFIKKVDEQTPPAAAPAAAAPAVPDDVLYGRLSEMTGGTIKSQEHLVKLINDYNGLVEQAEKGFEPKFSDERAKWAYQLLTKHQGSELETAQRTLRALSFNIEKAGTQKEVLFEGYLLDPKNSDLSPSKANQYFEAEFEEKYSLLGKEDSELSADQVRQKLVQERKFAQEVRETKEQIQKIQTDFKAGEEKPRQISEDVVNKIGLAVKEFGGIKLAFTDNPQETDYLNIAIDNPQELEDLQKDALNPQEWWNNFVGQFDLNTQKGYKEFIQEFHRMRNYAEHQQLTYEHGEKMGELKHLNKARNSSSPKQVAQVATPGTGKKLSFQDSWAAAEAGR